MIRRYTSPRAWLRALLKNAVHTATGSVIALVGTNGVEGLAPDALAGIGLDLKQAIAVFLASLGLAALRFIHESTASNTGIPFEPKSPLNRP